MNIHIFYDNDKLNKNKLRENWVSKNIIEYLDIKKFQDKFNQNKLKFSQVLYNYNHNISELPLCDNCKSSLKRFIGFDMGYNNFCSKKCASKSSTDKGVKTRRINTIIKHGVDHTSKLKSVKEKQEITNILKYGVKSPTQNGTIRDKQISTMVDKYGVKYTGLNSNLMCKVYKTRFDKYSKLIIKTYHDLDIRNIKEGELEIYCPICVSTYLIKTPLLRLRHLRYKINPCLNCNPISSYKYNAQNEIFEYIKNMGFDVLLSDRKILSGKEIDIYIPSKNLAIEFNGLYWHSELYKEKNYHLNKKEKCLNKGINLIHIWEDDWMFKKDIILSRIDNLLGISNKKIFARKCYIKLVSNHDSKNFLENNHLQGSVNSKINIGLYYNDILVSLMTFGNLRRSLGYKISNNKTYELYRFCSLLGTSVIGSFSKLLNYFKIFYDVSKIITYANRDWSIIDNVYEKNKFKFDSYTNINYYYFKNLKRHHRFQFRKDRLIKMGFDENKTESEIMSENGYLKVYDCGSIKYIME